MGTTRNRETEAQPIGWIFCTKSQSTNPHKYILYISLVFHVVLSFVRFSFSISFVFIWWNNMQNTFHPNDVFCCVCVQGIDYMLPYNLRNPVYYIVSSTGNRMCPISTQYSLTVCVCVFVCSNSLAFYIFVQLLVSTFNLKLLN